ncbi:MAG TPA: thiamine pyrophosphate-binding protein [Chthoniobacterales bacterium]
MQPDNWTCRPAANSETHGEKSPTSDTASDFLIKRLTQWGIRRIFGYPGDGINGIMGAINRAGDAIHYVQVRHEEMAAFMACAHAKFTGEVGVCLATSGPGAIHLLNGLYDAKLDHAPAVAIVGEQPRRALGGHYQQEVDLLTLFKDVAHEYVHMGSKPGWDMMEGCDTLLMVGSNFPYSEFLPKPGSARGVQIDIDGRMLSLRDPMEVNLVGDCAETLRALVPLLERKADRSWRTMLENEITAWWKSLEDRAMQGADPINLQRVF